MDHWMGAAPRSSGKQRGVDVDDAERRDIDDALRNDLAVADDDHGVGREGAQVFDGIGVADAFGLVDGDGVAERGGFHRRWRQFLFAAFGTVGLRDDFRDRVTRGDERVERGDGEFRRAEEDEFHSHSPAFCSFLILRLIRSRFSALR